MLQDSSLLFIILIMERLSGVEFKVLELLSSVNRRSWVTICNDLGCSMRSLYSYVGGESHMSVELADRLLDYFGMEVSFDKR